MPIIDWRKFLSAQKELEDSSQTEIERTAERAMALMVELNEFANATKVFKYWSQRGTDGDHILEEFADVFGFILTNILEKNMDPSEIEYPEVSKVLSNGELTLKFLSLMSSFKYPMSEEEFRNWIGEFFGLGASYGFSYEDLEGAYWRKWNINLKRRDSDY